MVAKMIIHPGDIIVLAAPSESPYMFLTQKGYTGCAFGVTNGSVSFKRIMIPNNFPPRYE